MDTKLISQCVTDLQGESGSVDGQRKPQLSLRVSGHILDEGPREVLRPGISGLPSLLPPLFTSLNYSNLGGLLKTAE